MNNITVDGSYFNNSFGLGNTPGDRTGVAPISLHAIEQVQVNVAPFDVRQGNFVGAGVNTVTRSGTNQFRGSVYHQFRNDSIVGTEAQRPRGQPRHVHFGETGGWVGGPIVKNKLFFFAGLRERKDDAARHDVRWPTPAAQTVAGNVTRVLASDLDRCSAFLKSNFNYDPGVYQGYDFETPAKRFLGKLDYNLNDRNKVSFRYMQLDSSTDVLVSNSISLGFGNRRTSQFALNFAGSNYAILENIRSGVGEWNSIIGTHHGERADRRATRRTTRAAAQIGNALPVGRHPRRRGTIYTSFGFEPFTPNNELRYHTFQVQDNFTWFRGAPHVHRSAARSRSTTPTTCSSRASRASTSTTRWQDFYTDANDYLANPNRTTSPVTLRLFQVRYINIPGLTSRSSRSTCSYCGALRAGRVERRAATSRSRAGLRVDVPKFGDTGYDNADADALHLPRRERPGRSSTRPAKLPDAHDPLVAARRLQLGRQRQPRDAGARRHRRLHRPAALRLDLEPDRQHRRADRASTRSATRRRARSIPNPDAYKPTARRPARRRRATSSR